MLDIHSRFYRVQNEMSIYVNEMRLTNKHMRKRDPANDKHYDVEMRKLNKLARDAFAALYNLQAYAVGQSTEKTLTELLGDIDNN